MQKRSSAVRSMSCTVRAVGVACGSCSPNTVHWTYDNWALANSTGKALVTSGASTWFFLTVDDAFGRGLESEVSRVVRENGGTVLGQIRHALSTSDFSSFLLQAQASRASIIGLANTGTDATNAIEQGTRLGIVQRGQHFASLLMFVTDVRRLGLSKSQGLMLAEPFYWDLNDQTRAWSTRFARRHWGARPTMAQAGVYSAVLHYLKAVDALKGDDGTRVIAKMKELPTHDPLFGEWYHPSGREKDSPDVSLRGEEAVRVRWLLGPLQTAGNHPSRRGVPAAGPG